MEMGLGYEAAAAHGAAVAPPTDERDQARDDHREQEDLIATIQRLELRCGSLEEEVDALRAGLKRSPVPVGLFGLTDTEATILGILLKADRVRVKSFYAILYFGTEIDRDGDVVRVFIRKIRKKIAPFSIEIQSAKGAGYALPGGSKAILNNLIAEHRQKESA